MVNKEIIFFMLLALTPFEHGCAGDSEDSMPDAKVIFGGKKYEAQDFAFCWEDVCSDSPIMTPVHPIAINSGDEVEIELTSAEALKKLTYSMTPVRFDQKIIEKHIPNVYLWPDLETNRDIELRSATKQKVALHQKPGIYIFILGSWWAQGDVSFAILFEVK